MITDINECSEGISGCAQGCINTIGGLTCSCNKGYRLGKDRKSCNGKIENYHDVLLLQNRE